MSTFYEKIFTSLFMVVFSKTLGFVKKFWKRLLLYLFGYLMVVGLLDFLFWSNNKLLQIIILKFSLSLYHWLSALAYCVLIALYFFVVLAMLRYVDATEKERKISLIATFKETGKLYPSYGRTMILYLLSMFLWSLLLLVPGFIFGVLYSMAGYACLFDGKEGNEALEFSKKVIKPHFFRYLDYVLLLILILFALGGPYVSFFNILISISVLREVAYFVPLLVYGKYVVLMIIGMFSAIFHYYLYCEFKEKVELSA